MKLVKQFGGSYWNVFQNINGVLSANPDFTGVTELEADEYIAANPPAFQHLFVAPSGEDYSSIQDALDACNAGDLVTVYPATYLEKISHPNNVTIEWFPNVTVQNDDAVDCVYNIDDGTAPCRAYWKGRPALVNATTVPNILKFTDPSSRLEVDGEILFYERDFVLNQVGAADGTAVDIVELPIPIKYPNIANTFTLTRLGIGDFEISLPVVPCFTNLNGQTLITVCGFDPASTGKNNLVYYGQSTLGDGTTRINVKSFTQDAVTQEFLPADDVLTGLILKIKFNMFWN